MNISSEVTLYSTTPPAQNSTTIALSLVLAGPSKEEEGVGGWWGGLGLGSLLYPGKSGKGFIVYAPLQTWKMTITTEFSTPLPLTVESGDGSRNMPNPS